MRAHDGIYVAGGWADSSGASRIEIQNPSTGAVLGSVPRGTAADVDRAVEAARAGLSAWAGSDIQERIAVLGQISTGLAARRLEIADTIAREMGMPVRLARLIQAGLPPIHFSNCAKLLQHFEFSRDLGSTRIVSEPVGVCGLITPWNFPLHQIAGKVAPAIAAGCAVVLKPSELAPLNAIALAEIIADSGLPEGVFNLVHGEGALVGEAIAAHTGIDMVSFTGSTRAGISVARAASASVKRVTQELGGKSANIILEDAAFEPAVRGAVKDAFFNSGQACDAPTRLLVPHSREAEAAEIAVQVSAEMRIGDPFEEGVTLGPVVSQAQFERVQRYIEKGIEEGASLVAGGLGRPPGMSRGHFVRPTVFARVQSHMTIAREEIFGPVLSILGYADEQDALRLANDSLYGLAAYVSGPLESARRVARKLRVGQVRLNRPRFDPLAPFGGYKMSGNGREFGEWGLREYLETKAILGFSG